MFNSIKKNFPSVIAVIALAMVAWLEHTTVYHDLTPWQALVYILAFLGCLWGTWNGKSSFVTAALVAVAAGPVGISVLEAMTSNTLYSDTFVAGNAYLIITGILTMLVGSLRLWIFHEIALEKVVAENKS